MTTCWQATPEQRQALRRWRRRHARFAAAWKAHHGDIPTPLWPPCPLPLLGMACGALTRAGTPCRRAARLPAGRCNLHGGRSTGPKTATGKARVAAAVRRRVC
jgi:hypothetical protein